MMRRGTILSFTDGRAFGTFPFALPLVKTEGWWAALTGHMLCSEMCWDAWLCPHHRPRAPEILKTLWSDPHSNSGIFLYFDMICPPWAVTVQKGQGSEKPLGLKHFPLLHRAGSYLFQAAAAATEHQQQFFYCTHS